MQKKKHVNSFTLWGCLCLGNCIQYILFYIWTSEMLKLSFCNIIMLRSHEIKMLECQRVTVFMSSLPCSLFRHDLLIWFPQSVILSAHVVVERFSDTDGQPSDCSFQLTVLEMSEHLMPRVGHMNARDVILFKFILTLSFFFLLSLQRTYTLIVEAWDWDNGTRNRKCKLHSTYQSITCYWSS